MTARTVLRERLATALPPLTTAHTFLALVPVTGDATWAAETAWTIARAAATGGRKVMLVDLCFDEPMLHQHVGDTLDNGIVDAFEYGVSLNYVRRSHLNDTLFFVPRGTELGDPVRVLESSRWTRLAKGVASQGALLLVYLTPSSLARLGARCDGILALAPKGYEPDTTPIPPLDEVLKAGVPLLAVVADEPPPSDQVASPAGPAAAPRAEPRRPAFRSSVRDRSGPPTARWIAGVVGAGALAALAFVLLRGGGEGETPAAPDTPAVAAPAEPPREEPPAREPEPPRAPAADPFATARPFVVQVAAYDAAEPARARAARLAGPGRTAFVTPLALGAMGTWYRVYVGPFVSERGAIDARAALWTARAVRRNEGILRRAPFALEIAADRRQDAERAGFVPYVVEDRVLVGAFEFAEQTAVAADALSAAGIPFTLVERTGRGQ